jgi:hypothetical protein
VPPIKSRRRSSGGDGRRDTSQVRPTSRQAIRESARRQPEDLPVGSGVTAQTAEHSGSDTRPAPAPARTTPASLKRFTHGSRRRAQWDRADQPGWGAMYQSGGRAHLVASRRKRRSTAAGALSRGLRVGRLQKDHDADLGFGLGVPPRTSYIRRLWTIVPMSIGSHEPIFGGTDSSTAPTNDIPAPGRQLGVIPVVSRCSLPYRRCPPCEGRTIWCTC